jgi:hypothetical protein
MSCPIGRVRYDMSAGRSRRMPDEPNEEGMMLARRLALAHHTPHL